MTGQMTLHDLLEPERYRRSRTIPARVRAEVRHRDGGCCVKCSFTATELHHVVPFADGGSHTKNNLASLCAPCHRELEAVGVRGADQFNAWKGIRPAWMEFATRSLRDEPDYADVLETIWQTLKAQAQS